MKKEQRLKSVREIIKNTKVCMFTTMADDRLRSRPMYTAKVEDDFSIYFFTDNNSNKIDELFEFQPIMLSYSNPDDDQYLALSGSTDIVDSLATKKELFNTMTKVWFPDGPESDRLALIKFTPEEAELWDGSDNKLGQIYKMGKALLTHTPYETSEDAYAKVTMNK